MRVLFLSQHLGQGGTTTHLLGLAYGLRRAGCDIAIAAPQRRDFRQELGAQLEEQGIHCFKVNFPTVYRSWSDNIRRLFNSAVSILRIIREFQPDVIHVQWRSVSPFAQFAKIVKGIPFVTTLHAQSIPSNRIYRLLSFWGDCAIAISRETYDDLVGTFGVPKRKIRLVYNGTDSQHFRPPSPEERDAARRSFGLNERDFVVAMVAGLDPNKRHELAIKALSLLKSKGKAVHLLVAGARCSREVTPESLTQKAIELGVQDLIRILGHTDSRTVLWASDLAVLPSNREGFGLVIIEAMWCGLVSVRTPAGGAIDQIEDGTNGFLFPFEDHVTLAERIDKLSSDQLLLQRMSRAALATGLEKFSLQTMIDQTLQVYESVLSPDSSLKTSEGHGISSIERRSMSGGRLRERR